MLSPSGLVIAGPKQNQEDTSGCRMANASEVLENEAAFCQLEEPGVLGDAEKDGWRGGVWEGRVVTVSVMFRN